MPGDNAGAEGTLFSLNLKLNAVDHGLNEKWHLKSTDAVSAVVMATVLMAARKRIMPADCEIAYATISRDDSRRDSKYIPASLGAGLFINTGVSPPQTSVNDDLTAVKIRLENESGGFQIAKLACVPDGVVANNKVTIPPTDVTATYSGADTVPSDLTDFAAQLNYFMKMLTKYSINVRSGHAPGGPYVWNAFTAAYYRGVGKKKGGKIFIP